MKIIPFTLLLSSMSFIAETQAYPNSVMTQNRSDVTGALGIPVSEISSTQSATEQMNTSPTEVPSKTNQSEKSYNTLSAGEVYPLGPYSNGQFKPAITEEERFHGGDGETRVNDMGPNKR